MLTLWIHFKMAQIMKLISNVRPACLPVVDVACQTCELKYDKRRITATATVQSNIYKVSFIAYA